MFDKLSIPVKGEPPRAAWGAGVANRLNELCAMTPARALVRDGATGTGFALLPDNLRNGRGVSFPKPFDIEYRKDEESGDLIRFIVRCRISNNGLTELEDWSGFPELEEAESATIYLRAEKPEKEDISDTPETEYSIVAKVDSDEEEEEDEEGLIDYYPLYRIDASGKVLTDYRDAFIRPFSIHTDEHSIGQQDYPDYPTVLTLSHFYDGDRDMSLAEARTAEQLTGNCDIVIRIVTDPNERRKVAYVPLSELIALINAGGEGGGSGGGGDPGTTVTEWVKANVVTSLNAQKGDLELSLSEGWMEIMKNGAAVNAVGTVTTSVSGLIGDMAVIGGNRITVTQEGNSLRIAYDEGKTKDDDNPFADKPEECGHPGAGGGVPGGGMGDGVSGENRGDDAVAGADCCGGSSGESAGVSTAEDGKGAATGTVVSKDGDGNTTTSTSYPGKQKPSGPDQSAKGKRIEDTETHSLNGPSIKGRKIGTGDIRKFENNDKRSNGSAGRIGTTDIHGFYNGAKSAKAATRL